jgi:hypothetical protein
MVAVRDVDLGSTVFNSSHPLVRQELLDQIAEMKLPRKPIDLPRDPWEVVRVFFKMINSWDNIYWNDNKWHAALWSVMKSTSLPQKAQIMFLLDGALVRWTEHGFEMSSLYYLSDDEVRNFLPIPDADWLCEEVLTR